MNKLEAIEIIEQNKIQVSRIVERNSEEEVIQNKIKLVDYVPLDIVVNTIDKIGLKRVVVPKYIADKIDYCKDAEGYGLFHAMDYCFGYKDSAEWLEYNQDAFALAWLDGYEVEKEKRYRVLIKDGLVLNRRLVKSPIANTFEFVIGSNLGILGIESFTKQELIEAGFGGVFDNEMFEVVEAEDD